MLLSIGGFYSPQATRGLPGAAQAQLSCSQLRAAHGTEQGLQVRTAPAASHTEMPELHGDATTPATSHGEQDIEAF